jgi:uroporphyrinogen-III synthase
VSRLTVLNTRPREQAAELSRLLRAADFDAVEAPAIATRPAWDAAELARARTALLHGDFAWIVLPSQNAGSALVSELAQADDRIVCGTATATALGLQHAATLERFSAAAVVELLRHRVQPDQRIFVPRAAEARDELVDGLRALDAEVWAPVAYRTVPVRAAAARLRRGGIDIVAVCSPSAIASIADAAPTIPPIVCLGHTTAEAAKRAGLPVAGVARQTSMASLVAAIEAVTGAHV